MLLGDCLPGLPGVWLSRGQYGRVSVSHEDNNGVLKGTMGDNRDRMSMRPVSGYWPTHPQALLGYENQPYPRELDGHECTKRFGAVRLMCAGRVPQRTVRLRDRNTMTHESCEPAAAEPTHW